MEEGYEKLNVREIATQCGIATGTLYNYYRSKQEIAEEILKIEWNMMLRRIEQGSKADVSITDKLGIVYSELRDIMNNVHNIWFENSGLNNNSGEMTGLKAHKRMLLTSLTEKIFLIINRVRKTAGEENTGNEAADIVKSFADEAAGIAKKAGNSKDEETADEAKDYYFLSDVICRLLASCAYDGHIEYKRLIPVLKDLLGRPESKKETE